MKIVLICSVLFATAVVLAAEALPEPWKHQDIGEAKVPGTAEHADGVFTLQGTMDIWGTADGCHIAWQPLHGDGELVARVTAIDNPGGVAHAKASLCIRESLDAGSRAATRPTARRPASSPMPMLPKPGCPKDSSLAGSRSPDMATNSVATSQAMVKSGNSRVRSSWTSAPIRSSGWQLPRTSRTFSPRPRSTT
jgi:hypothetical protein